MDKTIEEQPIEESEITTIQMPTVTAVKRSNDEELAKKAQQAQEQKDKMKQRLVEYHVSLKTYYNPSQNH